MLFLKYSIHNVEPWVFQAETGSINFQMLIPELLLRLAIAAVLTALLCLVLYSTYCAWKGGKVANIGTDINQVRQYFLII